jgi:cyclopropane fatty-acyl-phospholipid synthase-like methyltransferase
VNKPVSPACERNRGPILEVLQKTITRADQRLLEVGAGSGQHAVDFAPHFPWLEWHPSDLGSELAGMSMWFSESRIPNIQKPVRLDVSTDDFPKLKFDLVFTCNTLHIMSWKSCKSFFKLLGNRLREGSRVVIYGPFNYHGTFTSESNQKFDQWLKERDPASGIRHFEDVNKALEKAGFVLLHDYEMPANNRTLVYWRNKFEPMR